MFLLDCIFIKSYYEKKHTKNIKQNKKSHIINNKYYKSPEEILKKNESYDKLLILIL